MEDPKIEAPTYTDEEIELRKRLLMEMGRSRDALNMPWAEFDGMSYYDWYRSNCRAANSYVPPKKNRQDVNVVTGVTHEKTTTLLSALLNYNYQPNIKAYDDSNEEVYELGETMEALLRGSNDMEIPSYDHKRVLIYKEALDQGDAFIEDVYEEKQIPVKDVTEMKWADGVELKRTWVERGKKAWKQLATNLIAGTNFYPGNIRTFWMGKQPYIFTRRVVTRNEAKAMFGGWPRWENVPKKVTSFDPLQGPLTEYKDWTLESITDDQCEILQYQNKWTNEYYIMVNGVLMLPVGFPLTALNGQCEYTVVKLSIEPISDFFFYSKSIPAKTKVDQAIYDEMYRLVILKFRQSIMPPMFNNTGRQLTESVFYPAKITDNVGPGELTPVMPQSQGLTASEFSILEFVKGMIDGKSVSPTFEGNSIPGDQTAREISELQKNQLMKLGLPIMGVVMYEMERSYLRLFNILKYWTQVESEELNRTKTGIMKVYKRVDVKSGFDDGSTGVKSVQFVGSEDEMPSSSQVLAEENLLSKPGKEIRRVYLPADALRSIRLQWKIQIEPTAKDSDALERAQYEESLAKAMEIFPGQVNLDYHKAEFSKHAKWDKEKAFIMPKEGPMQPQGMPAASQGIPGMEQALGAQVKKPSINTLQNA